MRTCRGRQGSLSANLGVACWGRFGTVPRKFSPVAYRGRRDVVRGRLPRWLAEEGWVALLRKFASLYCGHAGSFCWKFLRYFTVNNRMACVGIHLCGVLSTAVCLAS